MHSNPFDLSGKVALVTGGSRGLGLQMVRAFAAHGADCIIASRRIESCEAAAAEVRGMGRRALAVACNASHWGDIDALVERAYAEFGRIDILVNNAGLSPLAPSSHETEEALFDKVLALNFKGPFRLASTVAARMKAAGGGTIINVSSTASVRALTSATPYAGAKAALNAMTTCFALEYGPQVRVNALVPGPFLTDIAKAWPAEMRERADNALGRPGRPEEIVTAALYLASPLSSFTTGSLVRCDGGVV